MISEWSSSVLWNEMPPATDLFRLSLCLYGIKPPLCQEMPMVRGFGCLELCIYGIKELSSATQCKPQTSNGPVWLYRYILWEADSFGSPVTLPCLLVEEQSSQVIQAVKLLALLDRTLRLVLVFLFYLTFIKYKMPEGSILKVFLAKFSLLK